MWIDLLQTGTYELAPGVRIVLTKAVLKSVVDTTPLPIPVYMNNAKAGEIIDLALIDSGEKITARVEPDNHQYELAAMIGNADRAPTLLSASWTDEKLQRLGEAE